MKLARPDEKTPGVRTVRALAAVVLLAAAATTWSQEPAKPAAEPAPAATEKKADTPAAGAKTPAPTETTKTAPAAAGTTPAPAATSPDATEDAAQDAHAPERFIPTQKSSADNSATFPIDI